MQKGPQGEGAQKQQAWSLEKRIAHPMKQIALIKKMCHISEGGSIGKVTGRQTVGSLKVWALQTSLSVPVWGLMKAQGHLALGIPSLRLEIFETTPPLSQQGATLKRNTDACINLRLL